MTTKKGFKQSQTNQNFRGIFPFEFDDKGDASAIPSKIHLVPVGQWDHDLYGPIIINSADIREFVQNFESNVRKGVFITAGHEGFQELPAVGWIESVEAREDGLWGEVQWNPEGKRTLSEKEFKFFSPEMCRDYEDPETHIYYRNVLTGGALTKSPYFKELQAIVFSDKNIKSKFQENTMTKTLEEVLKIEDVATLTDEDKAVLKENEATLSDADKAKFETVFKTEAPADPAPATDPAPAPAADPAPTDPTAPEQHSEKKGNVTISAAEHDILKQKADLGALAFAELEKRDLADAVKTMTFSKTNKDGKFLPKSSEKLMEFMKSLKKEQRVAFSALMAECEVSQKFTEMGDQGMKTTGASISDIDAKVAAKIEAAEKAGKKLTYSDGLKQVFAENKGLEEQYDSELEPVGKSN